MGQSTAGWIGDNGNALGEAGKTIAHGVTSGAIAEITGGKFAAGAAGGAMSELASNWSLGAFGGNEEYQVALNKVLGGLAAAAVTGDENDFDTGADRAETVHRYNYLEHAQIDAWANEMQACQAGGGSCGHINEKFEKLSIAQQEKLVSVCAADAAACQQQFGSVVADSLLVKQSIDNALGQDIPLKMVYDLSALRLHQSDAEGAVLNAQFAKDLSEKYGLDADTVTLAAGLLASAVTGLPIKGPKRAGGASDKGGVSLPNGLSVARFEQGLANLPPGERVAQVKDMATKVASENNMIKNNKLSKMNGRDVYEGSDGNLYALDTALFPKSASSHDFPCPW